MASHPTPERERCKHVELGGVQYEIVVYRFDENHRAEWQCHNCGESGAWAPISATPEGAIELAQMAIGIHHSLVHGESRGTRKRSGG